MFRREHIGRAGEYLVASTLEQLGCHAAHVTIYGADLWVQTPSRRILRVEVKTSSQAVRTNAGSRRVSSPRYKFGNYVLHPDDVDVIAYCALDIRVVVAMSPHARKKSMSPKNFTPERQIETLRQFFY